LRLARRIDLRFINEPRLQLNTAPAEALGGAEARYRILHCCGDTNHRRAERCGKQAGDRKQRPARPRASGYDLTD
jgi:hypothetical protein